MYFSTKYLTCGTDLDNSILTNNIIFYLYNGTTFFITRTESCNREQLFSTKRK